MAVDIENEKIDLNNIYLKARKSKNSNGKEVDDQTE
jgi:hypothetical protein